MSIARHTVYNLFGAVVPLAVSLVTVPLYLKLIGLERFGLLAICWLLVGYLNLFDFGLGRATAQKVATMADADPADRSRIFWTGAALTGVLSLVAMVAFLPLATLGFGMMKVSTEDLRQELGHAFPLLVAAIPFGIIHSLLAGALEGRGEFLRLNLIATLGTIATAVLPLLAAFAIGPQLLPLLGSVLVARSVTLLLMCLACVRAVPLHRPRLASSTQVRQLLQFGGWTTVTNIVGPLLVFIDRFAIGAVLSAVAVALYVVPFNLVSQLVLIPAALAGALFPRLASLTVEDAREVNRDTTLTLAFVLTPATLIMLICVGPFLDFWIGEEASRQSTPVAYVLLFGFWAISLARMAFTRLQSGGRPDLIAKVHLSEIIPYLFLLYFGMIQMGLVGAALAWSARCVADALILTLIDKADRGMLRLLFVHGILVVTAILIMFLAEPQIRLTLLAILAVVTAIILIRNRPPQLAAALHRLRGLRHNGAGTD